MDTTIPVDRYAPGGDLYAYWTQQYGATAAQNIYNAALTGDRANLNAAIELVRYGQPRDTSVTDAFLNQITTNPLGAPLESLNNQIGTAIKDVFKNPWVVFTLVCVGIAAFFYFGGAKLLKGISAK